MCGVWRNIYEGPHSCYALREKVWVPGVGVNRATAPGIAALILRDYERGWTYSHACREIPMTHGLFIKRLNYLIALARKHYGAREASFMRDLVDYVIIHGRLPPNLPAVLEYSSPTAIARVRKDLAGRARVEAYPLGKVPASRVAALAPKMLKR